MGTLFHQRPRGEKVRDVDPEQLACRAFDLMHVFGVDDGSESDLSYADALATIEAADRMEQRRYERNDLDAKDEQLGGFGKLAQELICALEHIAAAIESHPTNQP